MLTQALGDDGAQTSQNDPHVGAVLDIVCKVIDTMPHWRNAWNDYKQSLKKGEKTKRNRQPCKQKSTLIGICSRELEARLILKASNSLCNDFLAHIVRGAGLENCFDRRSENGL